MTDEQIIKANDMLDKFGFFNQRAGRELWSDKPKDVQDKDIENFSNDVKFLKDLINRQKAEIENQSQNFKVLVSDHRTLQQSFDNLKGLYEAEKAKVEKAKEKFIYFAKELQKAKAEIARLRKYDEERDIRLHAKLTATARAEAIKECIEKAQAFLAIKCRGVVEDSPNLDEILWGYRKEDVDEFFDNLVKEMVGDAE